MTRTALPLIAIVAAGLVWCLSPASAQEAPNKAVCHSATSSEGGIVGSPKWTASYEANVSAAISAHLAAGRSHVELTTMNDLRATLVCAW